MTLRLGDLLVQLGALTREQCEAVVNEQRRSGRPIGVVAEKMFGVAADVIERAWAEQYAAIARRVDPMTERYDLDALGQINKRQAWQFKVIPIRFDGREIIVCTTTANLPRALRFTSRQIGHACTLVTCDEARLIDALERFYPLAGARETLALQACAR